MTNSVVCTQTSQHWQFVCENRAQQTQIMDHCRISHGRSHGARPAWYAGSVYLVAEHVTRPCVYVTHSQLAFELMVMFA